MNRQLLCAALAVSACLLGCGEDTSYMPLEQGSQWSYTVFDSAELPTHIEVAKPTRVGKEMGWELKSPHLGPLTLIWEGGVLKTTLISGTSFDPPLPLLSVKAGFIEAGKEAQATKERQLGIVQWSGRLMIAGQWHEAKARLTQTLLEKDDPDKKLARSKAEGCRVQMVLEWDDQSREITTSFVKGRGIIRQTSKLAGKEGSVSMIYLSGPLRSLGTSSRPATKGEHEAPRADQATPSEPQSSPEGQEDSQTVDPATESSPT